MMLTKHKMSSWISRFYPKKVKIRRGIIAIGGALFDGYHVTMASQRFLDTFQVFWGSCSCLVLRETAISSCCCIKNSQNWNPMQNFVLRLVFNKSKPKMQLAAVNLYIRAILLSWVQPSWYYLQIKPKCCCKNFDFSNKNWLTGYTSSCVGFRGIPLVSINLLSSDRVSLEMSIFSSSSPCPLKNLSSGDLPGTFLNLVFSKRTSKSSVRNFLTSGSLFKRHPAHDSMTAEETISSEASSPIATSSSPFALTTAMPATQANNAKATVSFISDADVRQNQL